MLNCTLLLCHYFDNHNWKHIHFLNVIFLGLRYVKESMIFLKIAAPTWPKISNNSADFINIIRYFSPTFRSILARIPFLALLCLQIFKISPYTRRSPGSKVHSSRGALLDIPLRFFRTLLMMLPTPPELCCRCFTPALGLLPAAGSRSCLIPEPEL